MAWPFTPGLHILLLWEQNSARSSHMQLFILPSTLQCQLVDCAIIKMNMLMKLKDVFAIIR